MSREMEIQKLCSLILDTTAAYDFCDNVMELEHWYCSFCGGKNYKNSNMSEIKHDPDCEYSIAEGLMTGIK